MFEMKVDLKEYGHPDVNLPVDPELSRLAAWLPNYFADEVRKGIRFEAEQTIQLGWSLLKLGSTTDGNLIALEPDYETMPVRWVLGVSRTIRLLALQRAVCDECQVEPNFPSIQHAASLPEMVPPADHFTMVRTDPQGNLSGWTIHEGRDVAMRLMSLYEVAIFNRAIIPLLALPVGSIVERNCKSLSISIDGKQYSNSSSELLFLIANEEPFDRLLTI
ncbi:MAG: hypothetical protein ABL882_05650 [Sphingopyxis sp.]